jgi:hypothetical protein
MADVIAVELSNGTVLQVRDDEWTHGSLASNCCDWRLHLLTSHSGKWPLIYVAANRTRVPGHAHGELISASNSDPIEALKRCAERAGLTAIDDAWHEFVIGFGARP